jgi:NAD(P)-dependent dehydrogenase (short-subunit alcohol dehydrogenase family)
MTTEQKVAVITGASQGIGAALVKAYRDRGYRVVATARSIKPSNDDEVLAVPGDIADRKTAERAISEGHGSVRPHRHARPASFTSRSSPSPR